MKSRTTHRARRDIARVDGWWRENRRAAPELFLEELEAAAELIEAHPKLGARYVVRSGVVFRRTLLEQTRYHLYYSVHEGGVVIHAVWSAVRGNGPKL